MEWVCEEGCTVRKCFEEKWSVLGSAPKVFFFPVPKMFISGALNHFWHWIIVRRLLELAALLLVAVAWQATIQNTNYVCVHNFLSLLFWQ